MSDPVRGWGKMFVVSRVTIVKDSRPTVMGVSPMYIPPTE